MPNLLQRLRGAELTRGGWYDARFTHNGQVHPLNGFPTGSLPGAPAEHIGGAFEDRVRRVREVNGVAAAAVDARALMVSQLRFAWYDDISSRTFTNGSLSVLERPNPDVSRASMLYRLEEDASWSGNAYLRRVGNTLRRLRPDWVDIVYATATSTPAALAEDAFVVGYRYWPGGDRDNGTPVPLMRDEVMHFASQPHPLRLGVGSSWVTSVIRDIVADGQATKHVENFLDKAATANMVITAPDGTTREAFEPWVEMFEQAHSGVGNAWSNMYVAPGTDVNVVGSSLKDLDLSAITGGIEARIAVRSRVPATLLGTREGQQGSALNAGNYAQVRRMWADAWLTPYADILCGALERVVPPPQSFVELTYQRDRILFLQEDEADTASIQQSQAVTMRQLVEAGYEPQSVTEAVTTNDMTKLRHTGNVSVQLQPPGSGQEVTSGD